MDDYTEFRLAFNNFPGHLVVVPDVHDETMSPDEIKENSLSDILHFSIFMEDFTIHFEGFSIRDHYRHLWG